MTISVVNHSSGTLYRTFQMLSPFGLQLADSYLKEEETYLEDFIKHNYNSTKPFNLVVIGAGPLIYFSLASKYNAKYIAIEPLADIFVSGTFRTMVNGENNVRIIPKDFSTLSTIDLECDINKEIPNLYVFLFNVVSYINNPIDSLNKIIKPKDQVFISGWNGNNNSIKLMKHYFQYLDGIEYKDIQQNSSLFTHKFLNLKDIKNNQTIIKKTGAIIDAYLIST